MIKIKNNENEIIEVTQIAWDVLYSNRDGFSIYVDKVEEAEVKNVTVKEPKATPAKKPSPVKKKVTKNDKSN